MTLQIKGGTRTSGPLGSFPAGTWGTEFSPAGQPFGEGARGPLGRFAGGVGGSVLGPTRLLQINSSSEGSSVFSSLPPILLGVLNGMDVEGEQILGTYLYGGGEPHDVEDPIWTAYMEDHRALRGQIFSQLLPIVKQIAAGNTLGRSSLFDRFHAEFPENSGFSGYALLHGSNKDVGDFTLSGFADVQEANDPAPGAFDIELDLRFVFNDIVDPNSAYIMDTIRNVVANIFTLGQPRSYRLSIHWSSSCLAEIRPGQPIYLSGYPSDHPRIVRPLPSAKLDWVGLEKKRASEIETRIVKELQRNIASTDIASLADRKRKLLWLFYGLSGYMGSTYLDRISNPRYDDELPRLLHDRLSRELRVELVEALRGKRPQGDPPSDNVP